MNRRSRWGYKNSQANTANSDLNWRGSPQTRLISSTTDIRNAVTVLCSDDLSSRSSNRPQFSRRNKGKPTPEPDAQYYECKWKIIFSVLINVLQTTSVPGFRARFVVKKERSQFFWSLRIFTKQVVQLLFVSCVSCLAYVPAEQASIPLALKEVKVMFLGKKNSMQQNIQTFIGIGCAPFLIPFKCSTKCLYRNTLAAFQNVPASEETAKKLITNFLRIPLSHLSRNPRLRRSTIKEDIVVIWMAQAQLRTVISTKQNKLWKTCWPWDWKRDTTTSMRLCHLETAQWPTSTSKPIQKQGGS